jgi:subtilase family serine protease
MKTNNRLAGFAAFFCATAILLLTIPSQAQTLLTRHTRDVVVNGEAKSVGRLPASQTMRFDVVLALRHQAELKNFLQGLYDPSSSFYKQYVTVPEFTARFGPSQEDFDAVIAFAKANNFKVVGGSRDSFDIQLKGSVANVEKAFHVTMNVYQHPTESRTFFAPDREPSVDLPFSLWHVTGLDNYSIPRSLVVHRNAQRNIKVQSNATIGSCPQQSFCGSDMRAAYYAGTSLTGSGQNIGLLEYAGFDIADVNTYYKNAGQTRNFAVTGVSTDGSSVNCLASQGCDDTEQTLDITQAGGMAPGVTTVYVYVSDNSDTALLGAMSTDTPLPLNLSSSWTWSPADPSTDDPYFEKMAAQGQSFFQATGDSGGYKGSAPWPANSQYVIAVGGTDLTTKSAGGPWSSETAWADGGGGYGSNVDIPSWQVAAVAKCVGCSQTLRDVPDVAANANFTFYVCADQTTCTANEYGGTSFAAPMWAGYLALANQEAVANGAAAPGFIDPIIYPLNIGNGDADFHDITSGSNGFTCSAGYNLCDGWGSPNGSALITALAGGGGGGGPVVSLSPTSLTWAGKKPLGVTTTAKAVTLSNTGSATLTISNIATSGDFALATVTKTKKITPCVNGGTVAAGASCEVKVTFTPTEAGTRTGNLTFTDNAPNSPQNVALSGTGK